MSNTLLLYFLALIGPFVQEDAAIITATTTFLHPETSLMVSGPIILALMLAGLVLSDLWKYWIGWAGRQHKWARALAQKPAVDAIGSKILKHTGKALFVARFVPGTRIPAYIASGYFGVPFHRYAFWIIVSAFAYVAMAMAFLGTIGVVAGEKGLILVAVSLVVAFIVYTAQSLWRKRLDVPHTD